MQESENLMNKGKTPYDFNESECPKVEISDFIISQLFARGLLDDMTNQCLHQTYQFVQPFVQNQMGEASRQTDVINQQDEPIFRLPSFKTIESAISANKATVIDHIMKKRETKEWQKLEQKGMKDKINDAALEVSMDKIDTSNQKHKSPHGTHSTLQSTFSSNTSINSCVVPDNLNAASIVKQQFVGRIDENDIKLIQQFALVQRKQDVTQNFEIEPKIEEKSVGLQEKNRKQVKNPEAKQTRTRKRQNAKETEPLSEQDILKPKSKKPKKTSETQIQQQLKRDFCSNSETMSENDTDTEDIKFEKQMKKQSLKNSDKSLQQKITEENIQQSNTSRPRRQATAKINYQQQFQNINHENSHYQLVSYQNYKSFSAQPFQRERQKNVELCPISADSSRQLCQSRGQQLLGWYHSHPFFPVEPSQIDIRNHSVYQQSFDLENLPFIALIIGPYSNKNRTESLLKIFHLARQQQPYNLNYKLLPTNTLRQSLFDEINDLFIKYQDHEDRIDLQENWTPIQTREKKLIESIELILSRNSSLTDRFSYSQEIFNQVQDKEAIMKYEILTNTQCTEDNSNENLSPEQNDQLLQIESDENIDDLISDLEKMLQLSLYQQSIKEIEQKKTKQDKTEKIKQQTQQQSMNHGH